MLTPTPQPQPKPDADGRPGPHSPNPDPVPQPPRRSTEAAPAHSFDRSTDRLAPSAFMEGFWTFKSQEVYKRTFPTAKPMLGDAGYIKTGGRRDATEPF